MSFRRYSYTSIIAICAFDAVTESDSSSSSSLFRRYKCFLLGSECVCLNFGGFSSRSEADYSFVRMS
jgi:hypothetical protein